MHINIYYGGRGLIEDPTLYVLSKIEALTSEMEDSSISLLDMVIKYNLKYKK